jgi:polysaccharide export outer membrane protein
MRIFVNKSNRPVVVIIFLLVIAFSKEISAFPQDSVLPVIDYRIGSRDLLEIKVFELPELNQTVRVSEDGSISLSLIGRVDVSGLTSLELEKRLASILNKQYTKDAHVAVLIKEFQKAAILGAVAKPGEYELIGPTTLLQIIAKAGGMTAQATSEIIIYRRESDGRQNRIVVKIDVQAVNSTQDINMEIHPKDVITIPIDQLLNVFVYGEVNTPGAITFLSSKKITLLQAIAQAGGPKEWANQRGLIIKRRDKKSGKEIKIQANLKSIISGKAADIVLEEGDIVIVP